MEMVRQNRMNVSLCCSVFHRDAFSSTRTLIRKFLKFPRKLGVVGGRYRGGKVEQILSYIPTIKSQRRKFGDILRLGGRYVLSTSSSVVLHVAGEVCRRLGHALIPLSFYHTML